MNHVKYFIMVEGILIDETSGKWVMVEIKLLLSNKSINFGKTPPQHNKNHI
jgi:hypothetical protein